MSRKKILITGAAGKIGRVLRDGLKDDYDLRLLYHRDGSAGRTGGRGPYSEHQGS